MKIKSNLSLNQASRCDTYFRLNSQIERKSKTLHNSEYSEYQNKILWYYYREKLNQFTGPFKWKMVESWNNLLRHLNCNFEVAKAFCNRTCSFTSMKNSWSGVSLIYLWEKASNERNSSTNCLLAFQRKDFEVENSFVSAKLVESSSREINL